MNFVNGMRKSETLNKRGGDLDIIYKQTITVDDIVYMRLRATAYNISNNSAGTPTISRVTELQVTKVPHVS